jgi:hypothetical protein
MRLPEFTAEASLYRSSKRYAGYPAKASRLGSTSITAQIVQGIGWGQWGVPLPHPTGILCPNGLPPVCDDQGHCACASTSIT